MNVIFEIPLKTPSKVFYFIFTSVGLQFLCAIQVGLSNVGMSCDKIEGEIDKFYWIREPSKVVRTKVS